VARFGDAPEPALREQVAKALVNKGVTLGELGRSEEAAGVYDQVVARFGDAPEPALREQVAKALRMKAEIKSG
jgi:TolA-binding protein